MLKGMPFWADVKTVLRRLMLGASTSVINVVLSMPSCCRPTDVNTAVKPQRQ